MEARSFSLIAMFLVFSVAAQANLLVNGSFEQNSSGSGVGDTADGWSNFTDISVISSPDVWDNSGVDGLPPGYSGFFSHINAFDGTNFVTIAATTTGYTEGIESTPMTLNTGTTYRLSVAMAYDPHNPAPFTNPGALTARLRSGSNPSTILTTLAANTVAETWQTRTYDFTVGASSSYSLIFSAEDRSHDNYFAIDAASIEVVPEPASMLALGAGLAITALRRRRK